MIKPSVLFVKHFHHLNLQKFQIVNPFKKHGDKSWIIQFKTP
jgi:hypothetical protein